MVEEITKPSEQDKADGSQTILLLTRAEIRDIENVLDERAGHYATLTLSSPSVLDLQYPPEVESPEIRVCDCSHRISCQICARKQDKQHGIQFQETGS